MGGRRAVTAGLVLAAGAGTRFGGPKGLARDDRGRPWAERAGRMLQDAGCDPVLVAVGAAADEVAALLPPGAQPVPVLGWAEGLSASVRAGLAAAESSAADAVLIVTVDTPGMPDAAVRRILRHAGPGTLVQATYDGRPGHPVLVGREHWAALSSELTGDRGAGAYLRRHGARQVECADLWPGDDVDVR
jgi:CTP:molybdopterin cytidylyltransferase MocA